MTLIPIKANTLQMYSDASVGPASGRSHQGLLSCWAGAPIHWESSRQTLVALSTAEAELIALVSASQAGEAVATLIMELLDSSVEKRLFGDKCCSNRHYFRTPHILALEKFEDKVCSLEGTSSGWGLVVASFARGYFSSRFLYQGVASHPF